MVDFLADPPSQVIYDVFDTLNIWGHYRVGLKHWKT